MVSRFVVPSVSTPRTLLEMQVWGPQREVRLWGRVQQSLRRPALLMLNFENLLGYFLSQKSRGKSMVDQQALLSLWKVVPKRILMER